MKTKRRRRQSNAGSTASTHSPECTEDYRHWPGNVANAAGIYDVTFDYEVRPADSARSPDETGEYIIFGKATYTYRRRRHMPEWKAVKTSRYHVALRFRRMNRKGITTSGAYQDIAWLDEALFSAG